MTKLFSWLAGAGIGAGAMYLLDPDIGGRRRALARDKALHISKASGRSLEKTVQDLRNRFNGLMAEVKAIRQEEEVDDDTLVARVRAALGHVTSHTAAIEVHSKGNGVIELKGPIPPGEKLRALAAARLVRGVHEIDDDLVAEVSPEERPQA